MLLNTDVEVSMYDWQFLAISFINNVSRTFYRPDNFEQCSIKVTERFVDKFERTLPESF